MTKPNGCRVLVALAILFVSGCGPSLIKVKGRILRGGKPQLGEKNDAVMVVFYPYSEGGAGPEEAYTANFSSARDGSFEIRGKTGKGIPPGKYRIGVKLLYGRGDKKDRLRGEFGPQNSTIVREITSSIKEVLVDLDAPNKLE